MHFLVKEGVQMACTIKCEFSKTAATNHMTADFLRSAGFLSSKGLSTLDSIKIEFIKVPDAISRIVNYSESQQGKSPVFNIDAITTEGITLYYIIELDGKLQEDCFYFIPMHNIACLHTMDYFG